jgi:SNF2 family DNA or RNA helicase
MEMGTGKSKVLIDNIAVLYDKGEIRKALIVAPKGVYRNWYQIEVPVHLPEHIEHTTVLWEANLTQTKMRELDSLSENDGKLKIFIMNVEAFQTSKGVDFAEKFLNNTVGQSLIEIDESTTIKNPTAKRTKNILKLRDFAKYRRILTGSPVTKSPLDLYSQCYFLDEWHLGFESYYAFRSRYAHMIERNFGGRRVQIVGSYRRLDELSEKLENFSYRVLKKDCLDLPEKTFVRRTVELTDEQVQAYISMKATAMAEIRGKQMTTMNVITQMMRLHQITCGHFTADDKSIHPLKNNRLTELLSILEEVEGKVIIWANYIYDIENITEILREKYGPRSTINYYGAIDAETRQENIKLFQDPDSEARYFVGNTQTGGYGITLTEANTVIYYSNNYDLEKRLQSEDRAHRIGQKNVVTYIDLIAEKTVDERIVKALRNKINIANEIMGEELVDWIK